MILIRSRLEFVIACLAVALLCWLLVYLPPYEKLVYANSPVLSQKEADTMKRRVAGYKGGEDIKRVHCADDILEVDGSGFCNVILEINTNDLEATGIYQSIEKGHVGEIEKSVLAIFFKRTLKNYGQYYIATLESREKVPVFIDDSLINVHTKGIVQLPIGRGGHANVDLEKYNVHPFFSDWCLDSASDFATGPEMQDFRFMETIATVILVVAMVVVMVIVVGINFGKSLK